MMAMARFLYASVVVLSLLSGGATADEAEDAAVLDATDAFESVSADDGPLCACSPSRITFTLDFSLTCPPVNVSRNPGIAATFCQISPFGAEDQNIEDLVPVVVDYVDVLELGQSYQVLSQQNISDVSIDGDSFDYDSIILDSDVEEVPKVIQLNIFAKNANGEPIVNFFAISFSNDCDSYPTLIEGESAGWTQFTKLETPPGSVCPAVPEETDPPTPFEMVETESPTNLVTDPFVVVPTESPVETESPTNLVTDPFVVVPTESPVETESPTDVVTDPVVVVPTESPVETEPPTVMVTDPVVVVPTESPVETEPPTDMVTDPVVVVPTESPVETEPPTDMVTDPVVDPETGSPTDSSVESDAPIFSPTFNPTTFDDTDSLEELIEEVMSMDMSMSMAAEVESRSSFLRLSVTKSAKKEKTDKHEKSAKDDKKSKYDKAAKYEKYEKSEEADKKEKSHKSDKKEKNEKRRRLRLRPLFEAS